jgi:hypothetical protein
MTGKNIHQIRGPKVSLKDGVQINVESCWCRSTPQDVGASS